MNIIPDNFWNEINYDNCGDQTIQHVKDIDALRLGALSILKKDTP